jgi:hypothetical protein
MFVFWYCHKRGREVRLAKEAEAEGVEGEDVLEVEVTDEEDEELEKEVAELEKEIEEKVDVLNQPDPPEVPLPAESPGKKVEEKSATS